MKSSAFTILVFLILSSSNFFAQNVKQMQANNIVFVQEFMGVVTEQDNTVKVTSLNTPPAGSENKPKIELDDQILYINGNKVNKLNDFKQVYEKLKQDEQLKLGISRKGQLLIVELTKLAPKNFTHKVMKYDTKNGNAMPGQIKVNNGKVIINGKEMDIDSLKKSGVIIKQKNKEN